MSSDTVSQESAPDAEMDAIAYVPNRQLIVTAGKLARLEQRRLELERQAERAAIPAPHPIPIAASRR